MKYLALLSITVLAFASCKKHSTTPQHEYYKYAEYHRYQRIENIAANPAGIYYGVAIDSSHILFQYKINKDPKVLDGSYSSTLTFQAPIAGDHFMLSSTDLVAQHAWYESHGGWGGEGTPQMLITTGIITGQLQPDSSWKITIAVNLPKKDELMDRESIIDTIVAHDYRVGVEPIHYNGL
ncbi:MAG: hypothetical protein JST70_04550 [Bacteroidetes bacterium]|nr:hypothetical protein [Bacteroidota bacterium]